MVEKPELKTTGQKAFTSYIRSIVLQPNKAVFDATTIDADAFAQVRECVRVCVCV